MALITCPKCGKQFSDRADNCPQCGTSKEEILRLIKEQEERERKSRKWVIHCIVLVLLCIFAYVFYANRSTIVASNAKDLSIFRFRKTTHVIIPDNVTSIESCAFHNCTSLTSVTIPNSVKSIGEDAFAGCTELISVTIGNGVTSIGNSAFYYCCSMTSLTIPNSVTSIGEWAFSQCSSLTNLMIPNSIKEIDRYPLGACYNLNIKLPQKLNGRVDVSDCKSVIYY